MSWYSRLFRTADASAGSQPGPGDDFHPYELSPIKPFNNYPQTKLPPGIDDEVVKMVRYPTNELGKKGPFVQKNPDTGEAKLNRVVNLPFGEGDRVRWHMRHWGQPQRDGRVVQITDNSVFILWDGQTKSEQIPLNDAVRLAAEIQTL